MTIGNSLRRILLSSLEGSAVTRAFGIAPLKDETSRSASIGMVLRPVSHFSVTADVYRTDIIDRIVFSSTVAPESGACPTAASCPIRAILDPATKPSDLTRPGHMFPLVAKEGGVLRRAGHTEATIDLMKMAGLAPAGVLCEILDGTATLQEMGQRIFELFLRTASGERSKSELLGLGDHEFVPWQVGVMS